MKLKEQMKWAREIARCENIISTSKDKQEINDAQNKILDITNKIECTDPMALFDIEQLIPQFLKN